MIEQLAGLTLNHSYAQVNDVRLHYVEAGAGPLVVLLHGFPEFWYSWRAQIPALVGAGWRVVAPDMRGYNLSDKPPQVDDYRLELLARDVAALIRACDAERAVVVGHDWGALVAWDFAMRYPELLVRLAILNVPHPFTAAFGFSPTQLLRSWYIGFFQIPALPEALLAANNYAALRTIFRSDPVRSGAFSADDIEKYVEAAARPGALTAMINYYRALGRQGPRGLLRALRKIDAPVLVIWGEKDIALGAELAEPDRAWVPHVRVERLPDASHWVQNDAPEQVNALLLNFLRGGVY